MGWETRGNRTYYYRKERNGDKVVSRYIGAGEFAASIAQLEDLGREQDSLLRARWQQERAVLADRETETEALYSEAVFAFQEAMMAAGYRQHKRGEWRKQRHERSRQ